MAVAKVKASGAWPQGAPMPRPEQAGFTLMELMIAVAIVGILASIAVPSYRYYIMQTNRTDAVRALTLNAQIMQRCYSQNFTFTPAAGCTGPLAVTSANGNYALTVPTLTATTYTLTATPQKAQTADTTCASFSIDQTGKESALDNANNDQTLTCWGAN